ncbi:MAG: carotenoid biosynthesis protein [Cytophagales bacterium]|nr:carotenoid biosynthesis protein [Cytophagales bacterium]
MNITLARKFELAQLAVLVIWLFQISGIIGIAMGYEAWFLGKTPLNLTIILVLFLLRYPIDNLKKVVVSACLFTIGMAVEWIGVHYDFLFGSYHYGDNLGPKLGGVPWLIGINWMVLTFVSASILSYFTNNKWLRIPGGSALMLLLDYFMEFSAPRFGFWFWEDGTAPLRNYIAWFGVALLLHLIYQNSKIKGNALFSVHVYLSQLVFFMFFYGRHLIWLQ